MTLDINILPSKNLTQLILVDTSDYGGERITQTSLEVTPPGFNKINVPFVKDSVNIYDSVSLAVSCGTFKNLPDGVYLFKYSTPEKEMFIERSFMRTDILQCKFGKLLLGLHLDQDCYDKSKLVKVGEIRSLIEASISASNNCDNKLAMTLYNKANSLINQIQKCNCDG